MAAHAPRQAMPGGKLAKKDNVDQKHNPLCLRKAGVLNLGFEARAPLQEAHMSANMRAQHGKVAAEKARDESLHLALTERLHNGVPDGMLTSSCNEAL